MRPIRLKEQHLCDSFQCVNLDRQWRGVADFNCQRSPPTWFERGAVDYHTAAGVGWFAEADTEYILWHVERLNAACKGKAVGRDDAVATLKVDHGEFINGLGVNDG